MKEIIIYGIVAISSLTMIAYSVRMFIGGLVSPQVEYTVMAIVTLTAAAVLAYLAWDVIRRRRATAGFGGEDSPQDRD